MKLPIAINKTTNELVNAQDVPNGLACDCICPGCGEDLIAVNEGKVKGPHFRHTTSNCSVGGNYESYIHWLSKEVFKHLDRITLPSITFGDVERSLPINRNLRHHITKTLNDSKALDILSDNTLPSNTVLQEQREVEISSCDMEQEFRSSLGTIRADIVLTAKGKKLLIEPFLTNRIDPQKRRKIESLNISTITIDLIPFISKNDFLFSIEEFAYFLVYSTTHKSWEYINREKSESLIQSLKTTIIENAEKYKPNIIQNENTKIQINEKWMKRTDLLREIASLDKQLEEMDRKMFYIKFEDFLKKSDQSKIR